MKQRVAVSVVIATTAVAGVVATTLPGTAAPAPAEAERTTLGAVLVGGNEVTAGDTDGWGLAGVKVARREVCWKITVNAVDAITGAHIHAGPRGVAGPVVVPLMPVDKGCADVPRRTARFIKQQPSQWYVNVHSEEFPTGAVRGQLYR